MSVAIPRPASSDEPPSSRVHCNEPTADTAVVEVVDVEVTDVVVVDVEVVVVDVTDVVVVDVVVVNLSSSTSMRPSSSDAVVACWLTRSVNSDILARTSTPFTRTVLPASAST